MLIVYRQDTSTAKEAMFTAVYPLEAAVYALATSVYALALGSIISVAKVSKQINRIILARVIAWSQSSVFGAQFYSNC